MKAARGIGIVSNDVSRALNRVWRVFASGFGFALFGAAGLVLSILVFPVLRLATRDTPAGRRRARETIAWTFRRFIGIMRLLGVYRYELVGFERLERNGLLIVANHPSLIDTVFLLGFVPNSTCVVDAGLFRNSFTAGALLAAGYIRNGAGSQVLADCVASLDAGTNVLIFPEGTRTPRDGTIVLQRGAANIAVRAGRDLTPVVIQCSPRMAMKGEPWWRVPERRAFFSITVGNDICVGPYRAGADSPALAVRRLTAYVEQYLITESATHAVS